MIVIHRGVVDTNFYQLWLPPSFHASERTIKSLPWDHSERRQGTDLGWIASGLSLLFDIVEDVPSVYSYILH